MRVAINFSINLRPVFISFGAKEDVEFTLIAVKE